MKSIHLAPVLMALVSACSWFAHSGADKADKNRLLAVDELTKATNVLTAMTKGPEVPASQRAQARCIVVVPEMASASFLVGGQHGDGVVTCRTKTGAWSGPTFVKISGASAGLQAGLQSADLLMLVKTDGAAGRLFRKDIRLGADASVAAGPVGEGSGASTDSQMKAEILTYARSRGLFAGADLNGVFIKQNIVFANALYGSGAEAGVILTGDLPAPKEASAFLDQVRIAFP